MRSRSTARANPSRSVTAATEAATCSADGRASRAPSSGRRRAAPCGPDSTNSPMPSRSAAVSVRDVDRHRADCAALQHLPRQAGCATVQRDVAADDRDALVEQFGDHRFVDRMHRVREARHAGQPARQRGRQRRLVELHHHRRLQPAGQLRRGAPPRPRPATPPGRAPHRVGDRAVPAGQFQMRGQRDRARRLHLDRRDRRRAGRPSPRPPRARRRPRRAGWPPAASPRCGRVRCGSRGARCRCRCRRAAHRRGRSCRRRRRGRAARRGGAGCAVRRRPPRRLLARTCPARIRCRSRRRKHSLGRHVFDAATRSWVMTARSCASAAVCAVAVLASGARRPSADARSAAMPRYRRGLAVAGRRRHGAARAVPDAGASPAPARTSRSIPGMDGKAPVDIDLLTGNRSAAMPVGLRRDADLRVRGRGVPQDDLPEPAARRADLPGARRATATRRPRDALRRRWSATSEDATRPDSGPAIVGDVSDRRGLRCTRGPGELRPRLPAEVRRCWSRSRSARSRDSVPDIVMTNILAKVPG